MGEVFEGIEFLDDPFQAEHGQLVAAQKPWYDVLKKGL